jgi:hypothetical protein
MSYLDHITEFLFNENRRLSSKAAVVVFVILAIFLIDNVLGFSYYFSTDKIIKDTTSDSTTKIFALQLRTEVIDRENLVTQSFAFFRNIKWKSSKKTQINNPKEPDIIIQSTSKNNFWSQLTAGGLYYLFAILMIPIMVFTDKNTSLLQRFATGLITGLFLFGTGWFFYWLCNFIPQISKTTWVWNYILNFIIQIGLLSLIIVASLKKK